MNEIFELTVTRVVAASAKSVFEAWLDPAALAIFMKPMPAMQDCVVELDAREGGSFAITMRAGDAEIPIRGEYKTISRYQELSFTWLSEHTVANSTVTLTLKETGANECELTLRHVGFPNAEACSNHEGGWTKIITALASHLA